MDEQPVTRTRRLEAGSKHANDKNLIKPDDLETLCNLALLEQDDALRTGDDIFVKAALQDLRELIKEIDETDWMFEN